MGRAYNSTVRVYILSIHAGSNMQAKTTPPTTTSPYCASTKLVTAPVTAAENKPTGAGSLLWHQKDINQPF